MSDEQQPVDDAAARIAAIRAREQAATSGPWTESREWGGFRTPEYSGNLRPTDKTFAVNAREDVPYLLSEIERLTAAHSRCTNLTNAEAHRIFQEAREMREERDALAAIVGVECPIGDLSIVESLRVASAHAGQYAEQMQAERDAALAENAELRAAMTPGRLHAFDDMIAPECVVCGMWAEHVDEIEHKPHCILARRALRPSGGGEGEA